MEILAAAVAILVLGASIYFGLRVSEKTRAAERREVFDLNRALAAVAQATGLRFVGGADYHHPVVGLIPGYASLHGVYRDREIHVRVERTGTETYDDVMLLEVVTPSRRTREGAPPSTAVKTLEQAGAEVRVDRDRIVVIPRAARSRDYMQMRWSFPTDATEIRSALDQALNAADELSAGSGL